ncbi:hypothetical protein STENM36S_01955 [Streptomyces tendae]
MRQVDPLEDRLQQVGDGRFGDGAQRQRAHGDAELGGGHHLRQPFQAVQHLSGAGGAEGFDLAAAHGDEGELGSDEEAVGEHEQRGEEELQDAHRTASSAETAAVRTSRIRSAR